MKSIEEKAKRYDEAIKVANKYKDTHIMFPQIKDEIFPELQESEDEKIRKELISYIKQTNYDNLHTWSGINLNVFIAWLEKQGEQKPTESSDIKSVLLVHDEILNTLLERYKTSATFKTLIVNLQNWWNNTKRHLLSFNIEQKPVE